MSSFCDKSEPHSNIRKNTVSNAQNVFQYFVCVHFNTFNFTPALHLIHMHVKNECHKAGCLAKLICNKNVPVHESVNNQSVVSICQCEWLTSVVQIVSVGTFDIWYWGFPSKFPKLGWSFVSKMENLQHSLEEIIAEFTPKFFNKRHSIKMEYTVEKKWTDF